MWCIVQVSCVPHSEDYYPIPTRMEIVKLYTSKEEALIDWEHGDLVHNPPPHKQGQEVYQLLWDTEEPLKLDRYTSNNRKVPGVGQWLPAAKRILSDVTGVQLQPVPPQKLLERSRRRQAAERAAGVRRAATDGKTTRRADKQVQASMAPSQFRAHHLEAGRNHGRKSIQYQL